jgi:hypothetical protein
LRNYSCSNKRIEMDFEKLTTFQNHSCQALEGSGLNWCPLIQGKLKGFII